MDPQARSRPSPYWGLVSLTAGLICWILGDGHSIGVNPPIPENAKFAAVLFGWLFVIDGVRMLRGHRSFLRFVYSYGIYLVLCALAVFLMIWIYGALSLKALVAIGLTVSIALLVFILQELKRARARTGRTG